MALDGQRWSDTLFDILTGDPPGGKGFDGAVPGSRLRNLTNAVGFGSVDHVVGKPFSTVDTGTVPGNGVGVGTGVTGLIEATMAAQVKTLFAAQSSTWPGAPTEGGPKLPDFSDAIAEACVAEMAQAGLDSTHNPVFVGSGVITPGTILVVGGDWGQAIIDAVVPGFPGDAAEDFSLAYFWPDLANAIGVACAAGILASGTGTVSITGTATGTPVAGGGAGSGTLS